MEVVVVAVPLLCNLLFILGAGGTNLGEKLLLDSAVLTIATALRVLRIFRVGKEEKRRRNEEGVEDL